jgi:hypothetical protein
MTEVVKLRQGPFYEVAPRWAEVLGGGQSFTAASLTGYPAIQVPGNLRYEYGISRGDLPGQYAQVFGLAHYIVFSYQTPIAWQVMEGSLEAGWWLPDVTYSLTTTAHQYLIHAALHKLPEVLESGVRTYKHISLMKGHGHSPYGPRAGW